MGATVVQTVLLYALTVVAARVAGRRTLAQMGAFDIIVTIALGTLLASSALPADPKPSDGAAALVTLLGLQVVLAAVRQRFPATQRWTDFKPLAVVREGRTHLPRGPWTAQLTRADVESQLRRQGFEDLARARIVVLEPGGQLAATEADPAPLFQRL
ncbi:MAG TPA: YetF domain-containing protein [Acidimicrobiales bacterium]|nr:YetF domain-containing protein [Acidimicrobiales bacterium]